MQAAIGRIQLKNLSLTVEDRRMKAAIFEEYLGDLPAIRLPRIDSVMTHSYYRFHAYVEKSGLSEAWSRDRIIEEVNREGGSCFSGTCCEVYREKAFEDSGFQPAEPLKVAKTLTECSLMFPVHSGLELDDIHLNAKISRDVILNASS